MAKSTNKLSKYRQRIHDLLGEIEKLSFYSAHADPLIKGTPVEVYRACGRSYCKCTQDAAFKHGPYRVVQIYKNGKQKQVSLKKTEDKLWERVCNYQNHMKSFSDLKSRMSDLENLVKEIIETRLEELSK